MSARVSIPPHGDREETVVEGVPHLRSEIEPRDLRFDFSNVPAAWHSGQLSVSLFFDALAVCFPAGERFFIRSVKAHRRAVKDPALLADVTAFCAQEGHHGREHERYNGMLRQRRLPVDAVERRSRMVLALAERLSPHAQLGVTCALEHFTAMLGVLVLQDPRSMEGAHPTMAALWRWHSVEENEHKSVAYDVFRAAGGTWWTRVWTMAMVSVVFWLQTAAALVGFMRAAGVLTSLREHAALCTYLFDGEGGLQTILRPYLRYYAPSFHPTESDSRALIDGWKAERTAGVA